MLTPTINSLHHGVALYLLNNQSSHCASSQLEQIDSHKNRNGYCYPIVLLLTYNPTSKGVSYPTRCVAAISLKAYFLMPIY